MTSFAVDGRTVIALEQVLNSGAVVQSFSTDIGFCVKLSLPSVPTVVGDIEIFDLSTSFTGFGVSFCEAFQDAYRQLPEQTAAVAA